VARPSPGVARVVAVLDHLSAHPDRAYGLSDLSRQLSINKATAHALLGELTDAGYVVRDPIDKTYTLGPRLLAIGLSAARPDQDALERARAHLRRLAELYDTRCVATTVRGNDFVVLCAAGRDRLLAPTLLPGHRIPFDPPLGTSFLVNAKSAEVERWLARAGRPLSDDERDGYRRAIGAVRTLGCSLSLDVATRPQLAEAVVADDRPSPDLVHALGDQGYLLTDLQPGERYRLSVVSAPVIAANGRVSLALTIYDLTGTRTADEVRDIATRLVEAATAVTEAIGGTPLVPSRRQVVPRFAPRDADR